MLFMKTRNKVFWHTHSLLPCRSRNLGEIQGMLLRDSSQVPAEMQAMHQMSTQAYQGGIVVDGFAIFGSLTLFAVMIALSFGRVLGVDQFMARCEHHHSYIYIDQCCVTLPLCLPFSPIILMRILQQALQKAVKIADNLRKRLFWTC